MDITIHDRLNALQQISQRKFIEILDIIPGTKDLIIEQKLIKILDSFIGVTTLKRYEVDKIYKLEQGLKLSNSQRIFLVSSNLTSCKRVLDQIQSEISHITSHVQVCHHLLVVPFIPTVLHTLIEEEGLSGLITIYPLSYELIRLDGNVLSFENSLFTDLYYYKDGTLLPAMARNLWSLYLVLGSPKLILSFGKYSQQILKFIESIKQSVKSCKTENEIGAFILMDRSYDKVTTLLTPVTYSSLLNEVFDINVGVIYTGKTQRKLDPDKDQIYGEVRDIPCSNVFPILHEKTKSLKSEQEAIETMKLAEMGQYITTKLQKSRDMTQQLVFHISACRTIVDTLGSEFQTLQSIEKLILERKGRKECLNYIERNIDENPLKCLRLLCLLSICNDGIVSSDLQSIQKLHLHAHGYKNIPLFYKLQNVGLLKIKTESGINRLTDQSNEWTSNVQRLKLLPNNTKHIESKGSTCPSYVFHNAYIPLIAQILNIVVNQEKESKNFDEILKLPDCVMNGQRGILSPKIIVICIIGGISNAEIAACRLIEKSLGIKLVLVSDSIITGNKLIEKIQEI
ncbi:vacuolar protein sorting-associated protein 33B-like [Vespa mandarinia]|uniref:vacuolar protein sorting-associated protein 33B-like n=1 Tax=Vespa mandarinia TaxID=7446 RepID=UPI00161D83C7|nr:vacuolar protein sorting-associated protein 33B-like [Vespa mandarinia]XP_035741100.1 vacuolar protein sorting-associated protein 33B-like [Vespa mandarinia]XP_035741101.1 vacuolar protein sorting-associated protein 33B-like [Vespa mandarinia]